MHKQNLLYHRLQVVVAKKKHNKEEKKVALLPNLRLFIYRLNKCNRIYFNEIQEEFT